MDYCLQHSKLSCPRCRQAWERSQDWGIFVWQGDGRYRRETAVKVYDSRKRAETACNRLNTTPEAATLPGGGYVVRSVPKA